MGRLVLEDLERSMPVTLFASQFQQFGHLLADEAVVLVKGQVRERGTDSEITVEEILPLKQIAGRPLAGGRPQAQPQALHHPDAQSARPAH
jgi:DNA polymerase III alpha subunit